MYLSKQLDSGFLKNVKVVPMSNTAAMETASLGIQMTSLEARSAEVGAHCWS